MRAVLVASAIVLCASPAWACGGLFCSGAGPTEPVDQNAEFIVFEIGDGRVCTHVQIDYTGSPDQFGWIVPVPAIPAIGESDEDELNVLRSATALQALLPADDFSDCSAYEGGSDGGSDGCGSACDGGGSGGVRSDGSGGGGDQFTPAETPVDVVREVQTANYEAVVLEAERAGDLVEWLQENQYNVSDNMVPVMRPYVDEGMKFVAVKLREGRTASAIRPVVMCYAASMPAIPLRLTAVAAQPHMGIQVFVIADTPYAPYDYEMVRPDTEAIQFDDQGRTSYFDWVARAADEADGRLFVLEAFAPTAPASTVHLPCDAAADCLYGGECVDGLCEARRQRGAWVSRLYTRMSPEHMTADPVFEPAPGVGAAVQPVIDLTDRVAPVECGYLVDERLPSLCAFNYCGKRGECAVFEGAPACFCNGSDVAQGILAPDGLPRVTCAPADNPFGVRPETVGAGTPMDPCERYECGEGECLLKGGFPVCRCAEGALGRVDAVGRVRCDRPDDDLERFGPGAGAESAGDPEATLGQGLRRGAGAGTFGFAALLAWKLKRRRRMPSHARLRAELPTLTRPTEELVRHDRDER